MKSKKIDLCGFSFKKSYYLTHPWRWFRELKILIKNAYHRMKYGYAWVDLWNMDTYLGQLIPNMIRMLVEKGCGYPGTNEFPNENSYIKYMTALAELFELAHLDEFSEEYTSARNLIIDMHDEEFTIVEQLYDDAHKVIQNEEKYWTKTLRPFVYTKLGEASIKGLLWD